MVQSLKLPALKVGDRVRIHVSKKRNVFSSFTRKNLILWGGSVTERNVESCVWRGVSSHSSNHPQEVLLAQFSLHVHKNGLKPIHLILFFLANRKTSFDFMWLLVTRNN